MKHRGFIALTSVLILSAILLVLVVGASIPVFYARLDALSAEWKAASRELAQSCVGLVALRRIEAPAYAGGDAITVDGVSCTVSAIEESGGTQTFTVSTEYQGAVTALSVSLSADDESVVSEREIPNPDF